MGKSTTTLTLDEGLIKTLKSKELNISNLVNNFLKNFLEVNPTTKKKEELEKQLIKKEAEISIIKERIKELKILEIEKEKKRGQLIKIGN